MGCTTRNKSTSEMPATPLQSILHRACNDPGGNLFLRQEAPVVNDVSTSTPGLFDKSRAMTASQGGRGQAGGGEDESNVLTWRNTRFHIPPRTLTKLHTITLVLSAELNVLIYKRAQKLLNAHISTNNDCYKKQSNTSHNPWTNIGCHKHMSVSN